LDLPLPRLRSSVRHYLFCDSTWDLWRRASSAAATYSDKFMADTERLEQRSYDQMSHIFSISEYVRRNLTDHYKVPSERVTVVGTGRGSLSPYTGSKDYANGVILFVAKIRFEEKGGALLVEAFKRALRQNPRLRLVIVGDERYRASLGNIPNIEIHGFVPLDQLQDLFNRACLYAMPAPNEPWGLVYLEALACKTPVLGLNRNALPEITQQGRFGFCVNDATPDAVAEALLKACSDPEGLARMGAEGQEYCLRQFTWEGTVKRILDVIDASEARAMESGRVGTRLAACGR
jgi:glycosyltransferase involved in cell wall biosynthesis